MTVGATLVASLLVSLARPATWPLALATFLLRGGLVAVLAPLVVLPSAVALGNVLAPLLTNFVFRGVDAILAPVTTVAIGALVWLVGGGLVAAAVESELVRSVAADDDAWPAGRPQRGPVPGEGAAWRVVAVRLIALLPLLLALSWGAVRIVTVTYRELTFPSDVSVALVIRVAGAAPDAVAVVIVAWLLGETLGSLAARRVILLREPVPTALWRGLLRLLRHPLRCAILAVIPLVPLAVILVMAGIAGSATWDGLQAALSLGADPIVPAVLLLALVALFAGGLLLSGAASAWRAAVWTVDVGGTFGVGWHGPEGHWNGAADSGTLSDLRPHGVDPDPR